MLCLRLQSSGCCRSFVFELKVLRQLRNGSRVCAWNWTGSDRTTLVLHCNAWSSYNELWQSFSSTLCSHRREIIETCCWRTSNGLWPRIWLKYWNCSRKPPLLSVGRSTSRCRSCCLWSPTSLPLPTSLRPLLTHLRRGTLPLFWSRDCQRSLTWMTSSCKALQSWPVP